MSDQEVPARAILEPEQIKHMVDRFLSWKLPDDFQPDGGVVFAKTIHFGSAHEHTFEPVGTNLLTATQAEAMVRYMLEGLPVTDQSMPSQGWQPIETAPRDGTLILLWFIGGVPRPIVGCSAKPRNKHDRWIWASRVGGEGEYHSDYITRWMPIPTVSDQIIPSPGTEAEQ